MLTTKRNAGQFIPISAMVMFTIMVFMVATVNIYKVAKTKLKMQNLADAAALNLASQAAQAYNVVTDRNEWMNRMTAGVPSPSDPSAPAGIQDCSAFHSGNRVIPPLACVENNISVNAGGNRVFSRRVWDARGNNRTATDGLIGYAMLVHTINVAQKLFVKAYNSFLGAGPTGMGNSSSLQGPSNFEGLLKLDIPDLAQDGVRLVAWNSGDLSTQQAQELAENSQGNFDASRMQPLKFKIHHDIETRYQTNKSIESTTLGRLLFGKVNYGDAGTRNGPLHGQRPEAVGWMVPDDQPTISIQRAGGGDNQVGVGVYVSKNITIPVVGSLAVGAKAKAYLVKGSGETGDGRARPIFKPTYWVKLAN